MIHRKNWLDIYVMEEDREMEIDEPTTRMAMVVMSENKRLRKDDENFAHDGFPNGLFSASRFASYSSDFPDPLLSPEEYEKMYRAAAPAESS